MTIKTWQERTHKNPSWYDQSKAMQAEIDELREKVLESERLLKFAAVGTKILLARLDAWEKQEPVAWLTTGYMGEPLVNIRPPQYVMQVSPLYTKPKEAT